MLVRLQGLKLSNMSKVDKSIIVMTYDKGKEKEMTHDMPSKAFGPESGVIRLLELDEESKITITSYHAGEERTVEYQYKRKIKVL